MMSDGDVGDRNVEYYIRRSVLNTGDLFKSYAVAEKKKKVPYIRSIREKLKGLNGAKLINILFPSFSALKSYYNKGLFLSDVLAGLTVSSLHVPQGMAYGQLAGLKPINGIYTSFFPALIFIMFGASRHVSIGTFSVMSMLVAEPVDRLAEEFISKNRTAVIEPQRLDDFRLEVGITVTVMVGIMQFLMGLFRLGSLVVYISPAILGGFTCGAAMHVFASQLSSLFGIRLKRFIGPGRLLFTGRNFIHTVSHTNLVTFTLSCLCIATLALFKFVINPKVYTKIRFALPIELILLIVTTTVSYFAQLHEMYGVAIAGTLPKGLPSPKVPDFTFASQIWMESFIAAFVSLATTISVIKLYATRYCYTLEYTREMSALGLANVFGGFFQCHACSGGLARTSVAVGAGMQSQVATLVSCSVLLLVLTCIGPLLRTLPLCVLSSIIVISLTGILVQMTELPKFYRTSLIDLHIWIVTFLATVLVDIPYGLLTGLIFSLLTVLYRTHKAERRALAPVAGTDIYVPREQFDQTDVLPGLVILQTAGPIYFANCDSFRDWIIQSTCVNPDWIAAKMNKVEREDQQKSGEPKWWNKSAGCFSTSKGHRTNQCTELYKAAGERKECLFEEVNEQKAIIEKDQWKLLKFIILDMSGCAFTDSVGADVLIKLVQSYNKLQIKTLFCRCSQHVRMILIRSGFDSTALDKISFPTLHDAVLYAQHVVHETTKIASDKAISGTGGEVEHEVYRL